MPQPNELTPKELHMKGMFCPKHMDDGSAEALVRRISAIGDKFGFVGNEGNDDRRKHKYDVWIGKEVLRELSFSARTTSILEAHDDLFLVLDWAIETRPDLTSYSFEQALVEQKKWIKQLSKKGIVRPPPIDLDRIVFKCSNGFFLYLLKESDLAYEAHIMGHCVGEGNYKSRIKNKRSLILSLRDEKNSPHVTMEITLNKDHNKRWQGHVLQQQGKGNKEPIERYHAALREFVMFSSTINKDDMEFLSGEKDIK